jgi:hypothetical protein
MWNGSIYSGGAYRRGAYGGEGDGGGGGGVQDKSIVHPQLSSSGPSHNLNSAGSDVLPSGIPKGYGWVGHRALGNLVSTVTVDSYSMVSPRGVQERGGGRGGGIGGGAQAPESNLNRGGKRGSGGEAKERKEGLNTAGDWLSAGDVLRESARARDRESERDVVCVCVCVCVIVCVIVCVCVCV